MSGIEVTRLLQFASPAWLSSCINESVKMIVMKENKPIPTGNDVSVGDAREEGRADKDEYLKKGFDKGSPLSKPFEKN